MAAAAVSSPSWAQEVQEDQPAYFAVSEAFDTWKSTHPGGDWRYRYDTETQRARFIFGGNAEAVFTPSNDAEWFLAARHFVEQSAAMHGIDASTLVENAVYILPLAIAGSTDKMSVQFRQEVNGVAVEHGFVNVLFDMNGNLLSVDTTGQPSLAGFDTSPILRERDARRAAHAMFRSDVSVDPNHLHPGQLVIAQVDEGKFRVPHLAWKVDAQWITPDAAPEGFTYYIDAKTGQQLDRQNSIHHFDVTGTVSSRLTPGVLPDTAANSEVTEPLANVRVTSSQGNAITDANGNFNIVGATAPLNVSVRYEGSWHNSSNNAGADYQINQNLTSASGNTILMNPGDQDLVTSEANSHKWSTHFRNWIRSVDPNDGTMDIVIVANVNQTSTCNAFFNGSSVNYYQAGGGCVNTAFSTVILHEIGHWANVRYSSGNGSDGFGEGNADVFAMYMTDTPQVGAGFFTSGGNIRTGTNTKQFCGDCCGGCYGGVHADGEVLMGAMWKIRTRLKNTLGSSAGQAAADNLFISWMNAYNDGQIKTIIEDHWLTLDDDDGNVGNGTPNFGDIDGGFRDQGFPGVTLDFVTISNVTILGDTQNEVSPRTVMADVAPTFNPPAQNVELFYRNGSSGAFTSVPMSVVSGTTYTADIPAFPSPTKVHYYVRGEDAGGNSNTFPSAAPQDTISYIIGVVTVFYSDGFESASGWTHALVANQDDWQRSVEVGLVGAAGSSGDPSSAYAGNNIWGNDLGPSGWNGAYQDNTQNYLRSPSIDLSAATGATLSFQRWLTVESGQFDQAQVRVNNQVVWSNPQSTDLVDSNWNLTEIDISQFDGNSNVQIEFRLITDGGVVFGGWNVDEVEILSVGPSSSGCVTQNYCVAKQNSQGFFPSISNNGAPSAGAGSFIVTGTSLIPGANGIVFWGGASNNAPFQGGTLCVQPPLSRGPVVQADPFGFSNWVIPVNAGMVGNTDYYQIWYRDVASSFTVGLSDGLQVTYCQ